MLYVVAVQNGNYLGRGAEYCAKLFHGVRQHMPKGVEYRMQCFTDGSCALPVSVFARSIPEGVTGWWAKLCMFRPDTFKPGDRVLYFDLDTITLDDLSGFANYAGKFAALRDVFFNQHMNSAVMGWEAGALDHIWTRWNEAGRPSFDQRGDQYWIETMQPEYDRWQDILPENSIVSFKADCWLQGGIPDGAKVMIFHGMPRPHECRASFVEELWRREPQEVAA